MKLTIPRSWRELISPDAHLLSKIILDIGIVGFVGALMLELRSEISEGDSNAIDRHILLLFRQTENISLLVGPH